MNTHRKHIMNCLITIISLFFAFGLSLLFQYIFDVHEHITTVFVFAVFLVSLFTDGYFYGVFSAFIGTIAVNYAFTFPYFSINFIIPVNLISGIVMISIAVLTSALTTKLKQQEITKAESEKERMRANLLRAVSHDIRTPLTTIYGSSTTLLENSAVMTEEQKIKIVAGIKEDSEWLVRMVENLLSVTRIYESRNSPKGLLFHSDQGTQYTAFNFRKLLREYGVTQSFSAPGSPHDNAVIESFFSSIKKEDFRKNFYKTEVEFRIAVSKYIDFYNDYRPHQRLGYLTPNQAEEEYYKSHPDEIIA